ncbi:MULTISPECIES: hypothetical protein [Pseudomonas]|uniref:hypothetical protein n=1 Tax=Pseudomonas TaxID=286 RepID=UPI000811EC5D|nr:MULTISPECIES: hypothetical protein [unclassified Pseudomonas]MBW8125747.1 hypothetical protein [Pseudomonas sp. LAP_36]MBW8136638.1 hypothetical protein [Pseudomonas sp. PAMC 26818]CRL96513.1 hypothetical protein [Pseudomonas sp. 24 E 1]CRM52000.1 hypothetical protein [Pseudomonas sp. 58 R 12]
MAQTEDSIRLSHFTIRGSGDESSRCSVYANGNHQCELIIEVIKEAQDGNGVWHETELSESERASVTVIQCFADKIQPLASGWSCDKKRNQYDLGLQKNKTGQGKARKNETSICGVGSKKEYVRRFMRCAPTDSYAPITLVAKVEFDGQVYTSAGCAGDEEDSSVVVKPIRPFVIKAEDLSESADAAYVDARCTIQCSYWTPPSPMYFTRNLGLGRSVEFSEEGELFQTSFLHEEAYNLGWKAGVVRGGDYSGLQLHLSDIHHGFYHPWKNPLVRFHERPTIMRALHVSDDMPILREDTRSAWTLIDNVGTTQKYRLSKSSGGFGMRVEDYEEIAETNVKVFKIFFPSGQPNSNELYTNNRHQCKVLIEVVKEETLDGSIWVEKPLTNEEKKSATITFYSSDKFAPLPTGWSVDTDKNIFDTGIRSLDAENSVCDDSGYTVTNDPRAEIIERYMRVAPGIPLESIRFMARIIVGGVVYTTYGYVGNSFITLSPVRPYVIRVGELTVNRYDVFNGAVSTDLDMYYVRPSMGGVEFLMNKGLDTPLSLPSEGLKFQSCYAHDGGALGRSRKIGVLLGDDVNAVVRFGDIANDGLVDPNIIIKADHHNTVMRIARVTRPSISFGSGDTKTPLRLIDNYGCEQAYYINQSEDGNTAYFTDYN